MDFFITLSYSCFLNSSSLFHNPRNNVCIEYKVGMLAQGPPQSEGKDKYREKRMKTDENWMKNG